MRKYWHRFIYRSEDNKFPFWLYLMLAYTLSQGVAFAFFGYTIPVHASVLYQLTVTDLPDAVVSLWGFAAIGAVVMSVINLLCRYRPISGFGPTLGYLVWFYAAIIFFIHGYILQMITAIIWLIFWAVHHMRLQEYRHNVDHGIEVPPQ